MLTISRWLVVSAVEIIFILISIVVFLYFLARKYKKLLKRDQQELFQDDFDKKNKVNKILSPPDLKDFGVIKEKLAISERRVKNLEKFSDLFFSLKDKIKTLLEKQETMSQCLNKEGLPLEEQKTLISALDKLKNEKEILEQHLRQVEDELDVLMASSGATAHTDKDSLNASHIIQVQQEKIGKLIQEIADLGLEAATGHHIQTTINQLSGHSDELVIAIEVLQDENQFLVDQIQELLQQQNLKDDQLNKEIDLITSQLTDKQHAYDELYKKHVRLEQEYLKNKA